MIRVPPICRRLLQAAMLLPLMVAGCSSNSAKSDNPVAAIIGSMMPPTPGDAARDMMNPYDADRRRAGVAWLSSATFGGEDVYVRTYRLLITDEDSTVRAAATRALGLHGEAKDAPLLAPLLDDRAEAVRWEAAKALQKLHNPAVVEFLIQNTRLTHEDNADVRMACCQALGQYAEPRVFDALVGAINDTDFGVVRAARGALQTLTGYDLGSDSALWLIWQKQNPADLFKEQQEYTWLPFDKPPTTMDKIQFWKERKIVEPQRPTGLEVGAGN